MKKLSYLAVFFAFNLACHSQELYDFARGQKTKVKDPFKLRDPFKKGVPPKKQNQGYEAGAKVEGNLFTNVQEIDRVSLEKIKIVGILMGKDKRALAKVTGSDQTFILREGMKLGEDDADLKAILPGGIVVVEKIKNVYDQEEYIETIIPVSQ